ncbi:MAG: hypothetical protein CfP315_0142 [Candidatus Improbicoccus pseudotrichonymphae]|uniref:Uncharacterized protein n=1 Tax=Candidatus Improbicoccus pseudotrichonymphae TaxID=3033792 RepID=A0AA48L0P0_9FIRM|nr:MAG: hypothetical protein CfP315_0142 [Candidatus Improbicoccus pseudotrichonymphae]
MKIIHRASLAIRLNDIGFKTSVKGAVILFNNEQKPYVLKSDGNYVFYDLEPMNYKVSVECNGYVDLEFEVNIRENEVKQVMFDMSYSTKNSSILSIPRFNFKLKQKELSNVMINVILMDSTNLKIIEPAPKNSEMVKLNLEDDKSLILQNYICLSKTAKTKMFLMGYDASTKSYILNEPLSEDINENFKIYTCWDLKTNSDGSIIIPYVNRFMKDMEKINFLFSFNEIRRKGTVITEKYERNNKEMMINTRKTKKELNF